MKKRLSALLEALGELPPVTYGGARVGVSGLSLLLDEICPIGTLILHDKELDQGLDLKHLVVAPRGLVVVAPEWAPCRLGAPRRGVASLDPNTSTLAASPIDAGSGEIWAPGPRWRRSSIVRGTLRRAHALEAWLACTPWAGTPVRAAACSAPAIGAPPPPAVVIEDLWLGPVERLGAWLAAGRRLSPTEQASLAHFLSQELRNGVAPRL